MAATEIHGITDEDVAQAPTFADVAGDVIRAIDGAVVAAYNVYFDIRFLNYELAAAGLPCEPPHLCLMYMRPMLGLGSRCTLADACAESGVDYRAAHIAAEDALASAMLTSRYYEAMQELGVNTFGDLAELRSYKFCRSFAAQMIDSAMAESCPGCASHVSRYRKASAPASAVDRESALHDLANAAQAVNSKCEVSGRHAQSTERNAVREYWEALKDVVGDLRITDDELSYIESKRTALGLPEEQMRMLHARLFMGVMSEFMDDQWLDAKECRVLHRIHACLSRLGWAPGQPDASAQ